MSDDIDDDVTTPWRMWTFDPHDGPPPPTERVAFFIDGEWVTDLTMLISGSGSFIALDLEIPPGKHRFEFAALGSDDVDH